MTAGMMVALGALLAVGSLFADALRQLRRAERALGHAESERAWTEFARREGIPHGACASWAWAEGEEFACRCGCREVVRQGDPAPRCEGVSCVGAEHETRAMRPVTGAGDVAYGGA